MQISLTHNLISLSTKCEHLDTTASHLFTNNSIYVGVNVNPVNSCKVQAVENNHLFRVHVHVSCGKQTNQIPRVIMSFCYVGRRSTHALCTTWARTNAREGQLFVNGESEIAYRNFDVLPFQRENLLYKE